MSVTVVLVVLQAMEDAVLLLEGWDARTRGERNQYETIRVTITKDHTGYRSASTAPASEIKSRSTKIQITRARWYLPLLHWGEQGFHAHLTWNWISWTRMRSSNM